MFSDTHFHFRHLVRDRGLDGAEILSALAKRQTFFALDIGTEADDLLERHSFVSDSLEKLDSDERKLAEDFVQYSAGIWPDLSEIQNREERIKILLEKIEKFEKIGKKICAIGECGFDHHWNRAGTDARSEDDFDKDALEGEKALFEMQIQIARDKNLPIVIHSREAFWETVDSIENMDFHDGIVHCYSYGIKEVRIFLDLGYYIAFGGAVTYAKKSKMEEMKTLLNFVPLDRILIETDAPYLAPVPFRGQTNTPINAETVCRFVAGARGIPAERLSEIVDSNICTLFRI